MSRTCFMTFLKIRSLKCIYLYVFYWFNRNEQKTGRIFFIATNHPLCYLYPEVTTYSKEYLLFLQYTWFSATEYNEIPVKSIWAMVILLVKLITLSPCMNKTKIHKCDKRVQTLKDNHQRCGNEPTLIKYIAQKFRRVNRLWSCNIRLRIKCIHR